MLVLIIEDQHDIGMMYEETLQMAGFRTEHIADGNLAMERLGGVAPDLIVLDMNLPHVSGHYLLKEIRADGRLHRVPVIIATANAVIANALQNELGEFDALLIKPVRPQELRELAIEMVSSR